MFLPDAHSLCNAPYTLSSFFLKNRSRVHQQLESMILLPRLLYDSRSADTNRALRNDQLSYNYRSSFYTGYFSINCQLVDI